MMVIIETGDCCHLVQERIIVVYTNCLQSLWKLKANFFNGIAAITFTSIFYRILDKTDLISIRPSLLNIKT